ncbi:MAG: DUF3078 domain-containing protein [Massilibacteroides sp.]|nr:DUF3078 domain-containing protein [Massilibacteroides sp.]MDD3061720.1 DUF3078 domain-containing protein [Massilibacteroides sp.]MDD4114317.1 DUF3078 domain-containing protein [Massilibacteroides sp.]MDD4660603.1 DUF3078 domain-containing protein [Massilibacteroides sp.]
MKAKKLYFGFVFFLTLISSLQAKEQNNKILGNSLMLKSNSLTQPQDSTIIFTVDSLELNRIAGIRSVFEKQNSTYSTPQTPSENLLRFLKKDELTLSNEALYWARLIRDASYYFDKQVTFRDTMIVDPIYLPIIFKGHPFTDKTLTFYSMDFTKPKLKKTELIAFEPIFKDYLKRQKSSELAVRYVEEHHPSYIRYSMRDMPKELIKTNVIKKNSLEDLQLKVENDVDFSDVTPTKFIPERRYWTSGFESAIQFSQNYISPNWHKGGSSNLNLFTKNVLSYNYAKDKVKVDNQIEYKTSIYTAPKDTIHSYKISDDVLRLHNNVGYQAFNKWSYTFDTEIKTQLFQNYKENTEQKQAAILAPVTVTFGVGMKYDLTRSYKEDKHKKLVMAVNLAPLSLKYMYSVLKDPKEIDLGRHGFVLDEETGMYDNSFAEFGSSVDAQLTFNFNRNVTWQSRLNYFTSYKNIKMEYENTLTMAINRFFSTRIYLNLRYDDSVQKNEDFDSYFQINELLSFGFNYKW